MALFQLKKNYTFVDNGPKKELENIQESKEEESAIDSLHDSGTRFPRTQNTQLMINSSSKSSWAYSKSAMIISNSGGTNNKFHSSQGNSKVSGTLDKLSVSGTKPQNQEFGSGDKLWSQSPLTFKRTMTETIKPIKEEKKKVGAAKIKADKWWIKKGNLHCVKKDYKSMKSDSQATPSQHEKKVFQLLPPRPGQICSESQNRDERPTAGRNERSNTESSEIIRDTKEDVLESDRKIEIYYKGVSDEIKKEEMERQKAQEALDLQKENKVNKISFLDQSEIKNDDAGNESCGVLSPFKGCRRGMQQKLSRKTEPTQIGENSLANGFGSILGSHTNLVASDLKKTRPNIEADGVQSENRIPVFGMAMFASKCHTKVEFQDRDSDSPKISDESQKIVSKRRPNKKKKERPKKKSKNGPKDPPQTFRVSKRRQLIQKRRKEKEKEELEKLAETKRLKKMKKETKAERDQRYKKMLSNPNLGKGVAKKKKKRFKLKVAYECNCQTTNCIKAYCVCFKNGVVCSSKCKCNGCLNSRDNMEFAKQVQKEYLEKQKVKPFKTRFENKTRRIVKDGKIVDESWIIKDYFLFALKIFKIFFLFCICWI